MLSVVLLAFGVLLVHGNVQRHFRPQIPGEMDYHEKRVWMWLHPKCFAEERDVLLFKDHLLGQYECLHYKEQRRRTVYKHPNPTHGKVWSLWLDLAHPFEDFGCLGSNATLPKGIQSECIAEVYFEPLQHLHQEVGCTDQTEMISWLYGLDLMDGFQNNAYHYWEFNEADNVRVAAIVLDTDVEATHVEFIDSDPQSLFEGTPAPSTSADHGTHVAGTVLGEKVGVAKNAPLYWYPVCQLGSSCAWSDIEGGYEAAIALMEANPSTRFVINFSVGGIKTIFNEEPYDHWGRRIEAANGFWVTSAGNSRADACDYAPSFTSYAVTVGSFSSNREPTTWFTNYGVCVDAWGAGDLVYSATPGGGYGYSSGTSMASPHVCGLVINLVRQNPGITLAGVKSELILNSQPLFNVPPTWAGNNRAAYWNSGCQ